MASLNKAMLIGNLTRDPEVRTTPSGQTVASFSIATNMTWTDASGQKQEKAEFHNIVAWRKLGEICGQYLRKGKQVYIDGRLQTREWTGQDGVKRFRTEIIAENMVMLGSPTGSSGGYQAPSARVAAPQPVNNNNQTAENEIPTIDYEAPTTTETPEIPANDADHEEDIKVENIPF